MDRWHNWSWNLVFASGLEGRGHIKGNVKPVVVIRHPLGPSVSVETS
jgi:hypothetical protein